MFDCITGPLMDGRTRILVTHHVGLSLAKADYIVSLKDGKVEVSGKAEELKNSGALAAILKEANNRTEFEDIVEIVTEDTTSNHEEIQLTSDLTLRESIIVDELADGQNKNSDSTNPVTPKKLVKDEGKFN